QLGNERPQKPEAHNRDILTGDNATPAEHVHGTGQIIEHQNAMSAANCQRCDIGADESRTAGDEHMPATPGRQQMRRKRRAVIPTRGVEAPRLVSVRFDGLVFHTVRPRAASSRCASGVVSNTTWSSS